MPEAKEDAVLICTSIAIAMQHSSEGFSFKATKYFSIFLKFRNDYRPQMCFVLFSFEQCFLSRSTLNSALFYTVEFTP